MQTQGSFSFPSRPKTEPPLFLNPQQTGDIAAHDKPDQWPTFSGVRPPENPSYTHHPPPTPRNSIIQGLRHAGGYSYDASPMIPYQDQLSVLQNVPVGGPIYHDPLTSHHHTQSRQTPAMQYEQQLDVQNKQQFVALSQQSLTWKQAQREHDHPRKTWPVLRSKSIDIPNQQGSPSQPSYPRYMGLHSAFTRLSVSSDENDAQNSTKRKVINQQMKLDIIAFSESNKFMSVVEVARHFKMPRTTVHGIIKNKRKIQKSASLRSSVWREKCIRNPSRRFEMLEEALSAWRGNLLSQGIPVTGAKTRSQAYEYHRMFSITMPETPTPCSFTTGWLKGYMKKHGNQKVDRSAQGPGNIHAWTQSKQPCDLREYEIEDIYFCDELGMYLNMAPSILSEVNIQSENYGNTDPTISVFLCCSMDGKYKRNPFVLGTQFGHTQGCFETEEHDSVVLNSNLDYLDGPALRHWLLDFNRTVDRDTLLLMNETMWSLLDVHKGNPLPHLPKVRILLVPRGYNSLLPMDSRIAKEFKLRYYTLLFEDSKAQNLIQWTEEKLLPRLTLEQKLSLILKAWHQIPCSTIERRSWGFLTNVQFLQGTQSKSVPETESESAEYILKQAMNELPKLISYYQNQDKDTGPSRQMYAQVDKIRKDSEIQSSSPSI